ncbi:hypothetical protein BS47DRAFT_1396444 [Hydnum rufescens UP504]|uniref:Uncharacterized protein n=1 Tax=Hydnum rufescens UP504 TaxID=1448309 RepID=A0A9P6AQQ6_9AGAM|nr:hypothetical protein BS47DRAFT_1396444 [Hydnum rufescens UP504]
MAEQLGVFHPQISDKVFEEKQSKLLNVTSVFMAIFGDLWQKIPLDKTTETKHFVDGNKIVQVDQKLEKSLKFLGKSTQMATTYVAGKYWSTESGAVDHARKLGFGIVEENGTDLEVEDPVGGRQVRQNNGKQVMVEGKKRGRPRKVKP